MCHLTQNNDPVTRVYLSYHATFDYDKWPDKTYSYTCLIKHEALCFKVIKLILTGDYINKTEILSTLKSRLAIIAL